MSDDGSPVKVALQDETGKELDSVTVCVPPEPYGTVSYEFPDLSPGKYIVSFIPLREGDRIVGENPEHRTLTEQGPISGRLYRRPDGFGPNDGSGGTGNGNSGGAGDSSPGGDSSEKPPPIPAIVAVGAISLTLMGNVALVEDFILPKLIQPRPVEPAPGNSGAPNTPRNRLSPAVEARLEECLKANVKRLLGVPELTELVESLTKDDESLNTDFQVQVRTLYKQVQQLRKTIEECDPTLIQELLKADREDEQEREQEQDPFQDQSQNPCRDSVTIMAQIVNVRAGPGLDSEVIGQVWCGTCLPIDTETFASYSEQQRSDAAAGNGWYPVVVPDGRRGYIYSGYVSRLY